MERGARSSFENRRWLRSWCTCSITCGLLPFPSLVTLAVLELQQGEWPEFSNLWRRVSRMKESLEPSGSPLVLSDATLQSCATASGCHRERRSSLRQCDRDGFDADSTGGYERRVDYAS